MSDNPLDDPTNILMLELSYGTVAIGLGPHVAPETVERIKTLARNGEYDNVAFHRVIDGFMAQTGDVQFGDLTDGWNPDLVGTGGSSLPDILLEPSGNSFLRGIVGMARATDPDSGNSQFFITTDDATWLNGDYTVFGLVRDGMDFVDKLKTGNPDQGGKVEGTPDRILEAYIADDLAPGHVFVGRGTDDVLTGGKPAEVLWGLSGDDTLRSGKGSDILYGGADNDDLFAGRGKDKLFGGAGKDLLKGQDGDDRLFGQKGKDVLDGGSGKDVLTGGRGADSFVFGLGHGKDKVKDFKDDEDTLVLDDALWTGTLTKAQVIRKFASVEGGDTVFDFDEDMLIVQGVAVAMDLKNDLDIV